MATSPSQKVITPLGAVDLSMAKAFGTPQNLLAAIRSGVIKAEPAPPSAAPAATTPKVDTLNIGKPTVTPTTTPTVTSSGLGANVLGRVAEKVTGTPVVTGPPAPPGTQSVVPPPSAPPVKTTPKVTIKANYNDLGSPADYSDSEKQDALNYINSAGKNNPLLTAKFKGILESYFANPRDSLFRNWSDVAVEAVRMAKQDPVGYVKANLQPVLQEYARDLTYLKSDTAENNQQKELTKKVYENTLKFLINNGVTPVEVARLATKAEIATNDYLSAQIQRANQRSGIDRFFDVLEPIMLSVAIPGMGKALSANLGVSGAVGNAIANTTMAIANDANPQEVLRRTLAGLTAYQAGEYVAGLSKLNDPVIQNTLGNSVTQGVNAALLGEDVKTALLAGAAGGAIAGGTLKATDDRAIAAAAGEYTKNIASGMSSADAMRNALIDFVLTDRGDAEEKIKKTVETEIQPTAAKPGSQLGDPLVENRPAGFASDESYDVGGIKVTPTGQDAVDRVLPTVVVDLSAPLPISSLKEFQPLPSETGNAVVKYTDREGVVVYRRDITKIDPVTKKETGYSIVYDPEIKKFTYEWGNPVKDSAGNITSYEVIASNTRPTETKTVGTEIRKPDSIILSTPTKLTGGFVGPVKPPPPVSTGGVKNITQDILNLTGIKPSTGTGAVTGAGTTTGAGTVKPPTGGTGGGVTAGTAGGTTAGTTAGGTTAGGAPTGTIPAEVVPSAPTGVVPSSPITPTVPAVPSDTTAGGTTGTIPSDTAGAGTTGGASSGTTGGAPSGIGTGAGESTTIGTGTETGTGAGAGAGAGTDTGTGAGAGGEGTGGEGAGEGGTGKGGEGEGIGGGGGEGEGEGTGTEPMTDEDLILLGLISGGEKATPKPVSKSTTAAMQALSQALRIGDPGEPLFGSRLGKRKNVWNVESLRIKDELGG